MSSWFWIGGALLLGASSGARFVGAEACKLCHRSLYESWKATPHRFASERVPSVPGEAACLDCHATGERELAGVQCEACHGPGSAYSAPEVMIDPEKAVLAGLVLPAAGTCARCHENEEPGHRNSLPALEPAELARFIHDLRGD